MANVLETLLARLDADTRPMREALAKAEGSVSQYERNVDKFLSRSEKRFQNHGTQVTAIMKRVGAAFAAAFTIDQVGSSVGQIAALQDLSDQTGLTTRQVQELGFAFRAVGVSQDDFGRAMATFARHVAEVKAQSGEYYEFLRQSLPSVLDQIKVAGSQAQALDIVAEAMRRLDSEQARILLSQKSFGKEGAEWIGALKNGSAGLAEAAKRAKELNIVLGDDSVAAAKRAKAAYDEAAAALDGEFKRALSNVLPYIVDLIKGYNDIGDKVREFRKTMNDAGAATRAAVDPKAASDLKALDAAIENTVRQLQAARDILSKPESERTWADKAKDWFFETEKSAARLEVRLSELLSRRRELTSGPGNLPTPWKVEVDADPLSLRPKPDYTGADAIAKAAKARADAEQEAFLSIRLSFQQELEEYRRLHEERKITDAEYARVRVDLEAAASAQVMAAIKRERDTIAQQFQPFRDVIESSLSDPLRDAFEGNMKSTQEYFRALVSGMAMAINKALLLKPLLDAIQNKVAGPGGPVDFLNAIGLKGFGQSTLEMGQINGWNTTVSSYSPFAGMLAEGGPVTPGNSYMVGEHGVERFVPTVPGYIVPNRGNGADGGVALNINVDARGSDISVAERTRAAIEAATRTVQDPVQAQRAVQKRFPYRKA